MKNLELFNYNICQFCYIYYESKECPNCAHSRAHKPFSMVWEGVTPKIAKKILGDPKSYTQIILKDYNPRYYNFLIYKSSWELPNECFYCKKSE